MKFFDSQTTDLLTYSDMLKQGLTPIKGGILDQSKKFIDSARWVWKEQNEVKRDLKIMD